MIPGVTDPSGDGKTCQAWSEIDISGYQNNYKESS